MGKLDGVYVRNVPGILVGFIGAIMQIQIMPMVAMAHFILLFLDWLKGRRLAYGIIGGCGYRDALLTEAGLVFLSSFATYVMIILQSFKTPSTIIREPIGPYFVLDLSKNKFARDVLEIINDLLHV